MATTDATGKSDRILLLIIKDKLMCIVNVSILSFLNHSFYKNDLKTEICEVNLFIKTFCQTLFELVHVSR